MFRLAVIAFLTLFLSVSLFAADSPPQPDINALTTQLDQALKEFHATAVPMSQLFSPAGRRQAAVKMVPALKNVMSILQQISATSPDAAQQVSDTLQQVRLRLLILGDNDTTAAVKLQAAGKNAADADEAKAELAVSEDFFAHGDAAAELKALDNFAASLTDKANPSVIAWAGIFAQLDPANPDVFNRLVKIVKDNGSSPDSDQVIDEITEMHNLAGLVDKPLVVSGTTVDGKPFTTASWKGKVVFVDFWASWCDTCIEVMPQVKQLYSQYHPQGMEIVGVSSDYTADDLNKFTHDQQMPWPQLFDPASGSQQNLNPICHNLGITLIPQMLIIDRQGIVRSVDGLDDADTLLPQLLAQPVGK